MTGLCFGINIRFEIHDPIKNRGSKRALRYGSAWHFFVLRTLVKENSEGALQDK